MRTVAGRYRIEQELARRAELTWAAVDERLGRPVVLKELPHPTDRARLEAWLARARWIARVSHPGVVRTLDVFEDEGSGWVALERVDGRDLDTVLRQDGPLPFPEAVAILRQVLEALAHAGRLGIVHRDVKPANVILAPDGSAKLLDFGIAVREGERAPFRAGTPNFAAPELLRGEPLDRRADLFSAAALFYALATGHRPFEAATVEATLQRLDHEDPPMDPAWPTGFCRVLRVALAKSPQARYPSAEAMLEEVRETTATASATQADRPPTEGPEDALPPTERRLEALCWASLAIGLVAWLVAWVAS